MGRHADATDCDGTNSHPTYDTVCTHNVLMFTHLLEPHRFYIRVLITDTLNYIITITIESDYSITLDVNPFTADPVMALHFVILI